MILFGFPVIDCLLSTSVLLLYIIKGAWRLFAGNNLIFLLFVRSGLLFNCLYCFCFCLVFVAGCGIRLYRLLISAFSSSFEPTSYLALVKCIPPTLDYWELPVRVLNVHFFFILLQSRHGTRCFGWTGGK